MVVIKNVDIMSWAKINALFGIVFGLFYGIIFALFATTFGISQGMPGVEAFGLLSIIIFPIIYAIIGLIGGAIVAFLYNVFAAKIGGIKVELSDN
jgi:hypothetical protein